MGIDADELTSEYRQCAVCKNEDVVYQHAWCGPAAIRGYVLVQYSVRRYAHRACLVRKFGLEAAKAMVPEHMWKHGPRKELRAAAIGGK